MTVTMKEAATEFLGKKRIAVAGVSRQSGGAHGGNPVYQRLRKRGYNVYAVNPNAHEVEGDVSFPNLGTIPGGVDAVVIATSPSNATDVMNDCIRQCDIRHVLTSRRVMEKFDFEIKADLVYLEDFKQKATLIDKLLCATAARAML